MKAVYYLSGINHSEEVDSVGDIYEVANHHRETCRKGDTIKLLNHNTPVVGIRFYNRKGTKVYCITRCEEIECLTA